MREHLPTITDWALHMTSLTATRSPRPHVDSQFIRQPQQVPALLSPTQVSDHHLPSVHRVDARVLASNDSVVIIQANSLRQVERAFRLRYRVFVDEMQANPGLSSTDQFDRDVYDQYCEHLIAIELATDRVVATCRVLLPARAAALGGLYSDRMFWLTRLGSIRDQIAEVGRTCVTADHRQGSTITLLWKALLNLLESTGQRYTIGAANVCLDDGGDLAVRLSRHLSQTCMADEPWRAWPRRRLPMIDKRFEPQTLVTIPPLFKSYLRMGARLLGEPHHDEDFGTAAFPFLIDITPTHAGR